MLAGKPGRHTWGLKRAYLDQDDEGQIAIGFELDAVGTERFGKLTESNLDRPLAMLIDGKVISAPTIRSKITHTAMIAGGLDGFDPAWARQVAEALTQGMPPAPSPTTAPNER
jgi:preprotein translocase subunit SecD